MNMDRLNRWLTLAANLGVVSGILFLAIEVHQNNQQQMEQARFNYYQERASFQWQWGTDSVTQEAIQKLNKGEKLSPLENARIGMQIRSVLTNWEYEYLEYQSGNITFEQLSVEGKRGLFAGFPDFALELWKQQKKSAPPDFVKFMDEYIFSK